ncbi:MAG: hypothetical protein AAF682_25280 [Planctomycetota bacterium]
MPRPNTRSTAPAMPVFADHFRQAVQGLRGALTELLASVPGLPKRPLPMARALGLNKNLVWKVDKIVRAADPIDAAPHIPGEGGMRLVLAAFREHGAGQRELDAVRAAVDEFDRMVSLHTGDRASLALMLGSLAAERPDPARLSAGRKLAFQGNSSTLGVQARARFSLQMIAPSAVKPGMVDVIAVGGLLGFRRLRTTAAWPLLRTQGFSDDEPNVRRAALSGEPGIPLLRDFCSESLPEVRSIEREDGTLFELTEGPVGHTAESDWVFGWCTQALGSTHSDEEDGVAEFLLSLYTPAEAVVFDLLVHRDLPFEGAPALRTFSIMHGQPPFPVSRHGRYEIPLHQPLQELGRPPIVASQHIPRYREMVDFACASQGWELDGFRGYRFELRYPPIPSTTVLTYPLLSPPG